MENSLFLSLRPRDKRSAISTLIHLSLHLTVNTEYEDVAQGRNLVQNQVIWGAFLLIVLPKLKGFKKAFFVCLLLNENHF